VVIDSDGQFTIIHKGAPKIKDTGQGGALGALGGAAGALTGAIGGASGGTPDNPALGLDALAASDFAGAVEEPDTTEYTLLEFLKEGVFRIRDAEGQMIEIDRTKNRIYISNNDLKSTEDPTKPPASGGNEISTNSTDAEYVLLDKDKEMILINTRKLLELYSFDRFKQITEGDSSVHTKGDTKIKLDGDEAYTLDGSKTDKIGGDWEISVKGDVKVSVDGDLSATVKGDMKATVSGDTTIKGDGDIKAQAGGDINAKADGDIVGKAGGDVKLDGSGAKLHLSGGQVGLGGDAGELFKELGKALKLVSDTAMKISTMIFPTAVGPTGPTTTASDFAKISADLTEIKAVIDQLTGSLG
jgi:hypothetical protein